MRKAVWLLIVLTVVHQTIRSQEKQEPVSRFKNTVHFNITNPVIFGSRAIVFGYERVLNKNHSITVNFGLTSFPTFGIINSDSVQVSTMRDRSGINISADYRVYLLKENKYPAPRGIYIGPYYSYNYFGNKLSWLFKSTNGSTSPVESETKLNIHTFGFELGYQFICWDRLTLDMILLGPGVASYNLKATLGTNLSQAEKEKFYKVLDDALTNKFPGYQLSIKSDEFRKTGTANTASVGYRYMIQVGFRF